MSFRLEFETGNAAFGDQPAIEVARLLRQTADGVAGGFKSGPVADINGNTVGSWYLGEDDQ